MIDIKIHEHTVSTVNEFLVSNEQFGDDWREEKTGLNDLLAEVKRLREGIIHVAMNLEVAGEHGFAKDLKEMIE
jgi:hypothetical protein